MASEKEILLNPVGEIDPLEIPLAPNCQTCLVK